MKTIAINSFTVRGRVSDASLSENDGKLRLTFTVNDLNGLSYKKTARESDTISAETLRAIGKGTRVEFTVRLEEDPQNAPAHKPVVSHLRVLEDDEPLDQELS